MVSDLGKDNFSLAEKSVLGSSHPNTGHFRASIRYPNLLRLSDIAIGPANTHIDPAPRPQ